MGNDPEWFESSRHAGARFKLDEERRRVSAERRAKIHFGREDPFTVFRLARRTGFLLGEIQRLSQQDDVQRKQFAEIGLEKSERTLGGRNGLESQTAGMAFFIIARIVRVTGSAMRRSTRVVLMVTGLRVIVARTVVRMSEQKLRGAKRGGRNPNEKQEQGADSPANAKFRLSVADHNPMAQTKSCNRTSLSTAVMAEGRMSANPGFFLQLEASSLAADSMALRLWSDYSRGCSLVRGQLFSSLR